MMNEDEIDQVLQAAFESLGPQLAANLLSDFEWGQVEGMLALWLGRPPTERERQLFIRERSLVHLRELQRQQLSQAYRRLVDEMKVKALASGPMWPLWEIFKWTALASGLPLAIELSQAKPAKKAASQ